MNPETPLIVIAISSEDLTVEQSHDIRQILDAAFHGDFTDFDWENACGGLHFIGTSDGQIVSHASVVQRQIAVSEMWLRTGYVEAVATRPDLQGQGLGSEVMLAVTEMIRRQYEMGALSTGEHSFYERMGWERWLGPTWVWRGNTRERTPDEDGGVMVLRYGPSASVDLTLGIACHRRDGDDW